MSFLRASSPLGGLKTLIRISAAFFAANALLAFDDIPTVGYQPSLKLIEGDQPVITSYTLTIKSPYNLAANSNVTVTPVISVNNAPAGVSVDTAKSFVTLSASSVTFTGPNQAKDITVSVNVPLGTEAGAYVWAISTQGWAAGTSDPNAFINAKVTVPQVSGPPAVAISTPLDNAIFNQPYSALPLSIPLSFTVTAPSVSPITSIDADINGTAISLTSSGIGTGSVQANGTIPVSLPGVFTVRARATNNAGTSADTTEITVNISAPAPVVAITSPTGSNFNYTGTTLGIPFTFTGTSAFGNVTSLAATLNGNPVTVTAGGLGSLLATGTGTLSINAAGTYTLAVTATSAYGTSSVSKTFSVSAGQSIPPPTVAIAQPLNGAVFTRTVGSAATVIPFSFTATAGAGSTITSIKGTLNGEPVSLSPTGLNSATATGTGSLSIAAPGTYTFVASATSEGGNGSKSISFTVNETPAPTADCTIHWLPPIVLGKVQKGGSVLPIKFTIDCCCRRCGGDRDDDDCSQNHRRSGNGYGWGRTPCDNEHDTSVVIFIYEIKANGATTEPEIFTYSRNGKFSRRDDTYEIDGNHYHLDYGTDDGVHRYHIDVYRQNPNSSAPQLLGTKEFTTK